MTKIKICGITNQHDAQMAVAMGADAVGFVFAESPRRVTPKKVEEIIRGLSPFVLRVGVFVNEDPGVVKKIVERTGLDLIQLHGEETPEWEKWFPGRIIRTFSRALPLEWEKKARAFLMDALVPGRRGGTGKRADWTLAASYAQKVPLILAGGLNADNVGEAIRFVKPAMVDVSSGVEESPGKKNFEKMRDFFIAVKEADKYDAMAR